MKPLPISPVCVQRFYIYRQKPWPVDVYSCSQSWQGLQRNSLNKEAPAEPLGLCKAFTMKGHGGCGPGDTLATPSQWNSFPLLLLGMCTPRRHRGEAAEVTHRDRRGSAGLCEGHRCRLEAQRALSCLAPYSRAPRGDSTVMMTAIPVR